MEKWKDQKGSITLFVLISMLFFVLFLTGMFMISSNQEKTGLEETGRIKEIYEKDVNRIDDVYADLAKETSPNEPAMAEGMSAIIFNQDTGEISTPAAQSQWYNYANQEWANAVTEDRKHVGMDTKICL